MLEEDYLAIENNLNNERFGTNQLENQDVEQLSKLSSSVVRDVILPILEKEVNEGKSFANLRQIFNSMVLSTWYKRNLKENLLGKIYVEKNKINGVDVEDKQIKQKIYQQYLEAFKKGAYDYIRDDYEPFTQTIIPRKYFSGGYEHDGTAIIEKKVAASTLMKELGERQITSFTVASVFDSIKTGASPIEKSAGKTVTAEDLAKIPTELLQNTNIVFENISLFLKRMENSDRDMRIKGIHALGLLMETGIADKKIIEEMLFFKKLVKALNGGEKDVREAVVAALGNRILMGGDLASQIISTLLKILESEGPWQVRAATVRALGKGLSQRGP